LIIDNELTFEATDFEARSDVAYRVKVQATFISRFIGVIISTETVDKTRLVLSSLPLAISKSALVLVMVKVRASCRLSC
jgi:hypothetical protein